MDLPSLSFTALLVSNEKEDRCTILGTCSERLLSPCDESWVSSLLYLLGSITLKKEELLCW